MVISWKVREEADSGILWRAYRSTILGPVGELEGPGNRLGMTFCSAPEPSLRPSSSIGPDLEECEPLPNLRLCNLLAVAIFLGLIL